jgi:hypothetical protein
MQKVFVMYKLKEGVPLDDYIRWSQEVDQRITPGQPGMIRFEVYVIEGQDGEGEPTYDIVEDLEVTSWEEWEKTVAGDGMAYIRETGVHFVDLSTVVTMYGSRILSTLPEGSRPSLS